MKTIVTLFALVVLMNGGLAVAQHLPEEVAEQSVRLKELFKELDKQMVRVQGGSFIMGCQDGRDVNCRDDEKPAREVRLESFAIARYEVTQELWEAVMGNNPSGFQGCARCPVERVSWGEIQTFLRRLNAQTGVTYRLPTEAEWEYAARGGQQSRGYRHAGGNDLSSIAWYEGNSEDRTHPVGQKQPNELGLYDMSGNVSEWTQDCWHENYNSAPTDGRAWEPGNCGQRVLRGGNWVHASTSSPLRVADRYWASDFWRDIFFGFRLARTLTPSIVRMQVHPRLPDLA